MSVLESKILMYQSITTSETVSVVTDEAEAFSGPELHGMVSELIRAEEEFRKYTDNLDSWECTEDDLEALRELHTTYNDALTNILNI